MAICMNCKYWIELPHQYYQEQKYVGFGTCSVPSRRVPRPGVMVERDHALYTKAEHGCTEFSQRENLNAEQIYNALSRQRMSVTYERGVKDALGWVLGKQPQPELDCAPVHPMKSGALNVSYVFRTLSADDSLPCPCGEWMHSTKDVSDHWRKGHFIITPDESPEQAVGGAAPHIEDTAC